MSAHIKVAEEMNLVIGTAIDTRHMIEIRHRNYRRWLEPCCLGTDKDDRWALWAWQVNSSPGWRLFYVDEIVELRDTGEIFFPSRYGYDVCHPNIISIHTRMEQF
jgi:hypothetical protein